MPFLLAFVPYALAEGIVRPMAFVVLLDQPPDRVGAAPSFSNFSYSILTSVATVMATLPWPNFVVGIAALTAGAAVVMVGLYPWGLRKHGRAGDASGLAGAGKSGRARCPPCLGFARARERFEGPIECPAWDGFAGGINGRSAARIDRVVVSSLSA
ncbi:MAG: hypothetical protein V8S24_06620 [Gordonibacter pamelaeae]